MENKINKNIGMKLCKCGCGEKIVLKNHHKYRGIPIYIKGHASKGKICWNKGLTKETDARLKKQSDTMIQTYKDNPEIRKIIGEKSKKVVRTKEWKRKIKESLTGRRYTKEFKDKLKMIHNSEEVNKKYRGKNNSNWRGGLSFQPYTSDFNKFFKLMIRQRDNLTCIKCNLFEDDCIKLYNRKLTIHHIDYIKKNTFKENCCALCVRCNSEVNFNRQHWRKFFQSLLHDRYGYNFEIIKMTLEDFKEKIKEVKSDGI